MMRSFFTEPIGSTRPQLNGLVRCAAGGVVALICSLLLIPAIAQEISPRERLEQALGLGKPVTQEAAANSDQETQDERVQQGTLPPPLLQGPQRSEQQVVESDEGPPVDAEGRPINLQDMQPYLGVRTADLTNALASELGVPVYSGAVLQEVVPDSPAAKAGLAVGSVVVAVDGRRVDRGADLEMQVARKQPGEEILVLFYEGRKLSRAKFLVGGIESAPVSDSVASEVRPAQPEPVAERSESRRPRLTEVPRDRNNDNGDRSRRNGEPRGRLLRRLINPDRDGPGRLLGRLQIFDDRRGDDEDERDEDERDEFSDELAAVELPVPVEAQERVFTGEDLDLNQLLEMISRQEQQIADLQRRVFELERRLSTTANSRDR